MSTRPKTAVIMAGGTGGHIFPGLAVADALRAAGWSVSWMGARSGMEARLVPGHGYPMLWVDFGGLRGKGLATRLAMPLRLLRATRQALAALRALRPALVVGMGGYITVPGGLASRLVGARLVLHEQNAVAGMANRLLSRIAARVLCGFPDAIAGGEWVGNPVREAIRDLPDPAARYAGRSGPLRLLVVGGSLGAAALNARVPEAVALIERAGAGQQGDGGRPLVLHQTGRGHLETTRAAYAAAGVEADCREFIDDMAAAYRDADLVICRAGASTVAEVAAAGVAALFVPFPFAVDDHQTANATFLSGRDAALLVQQSSLDAARLAAMLRATSRETLAAMAGRARALARGDAARAVVAACENLDTRE